MATLGTNAYTLLDVAKRIDPDGKAAQVAPVDKLSVVLVAVFAVLFLGEQLSTAHWIAVVMIGGGALLLALPI